MLDMLNNLALALMTALFTSIFLMIGLNRSIVSMKTELKDELEAWLNSEKGHSALYSIGMLVGVGARDSLGLKGGSKSTSLKGIAGEIISGIAQRFIGQVVPNQSPTPQTEENRFPIQ